MSIGLLCAHPKQGKKNNKATCQHIYIHIYMEFGSQMDWNKTGKNLEDMGVPYNKIK
jgi:hypothetical protein